LKKRFAGGEVGLRSPGNFANGGAEKGVRKLECSARSESTAMNLRTVRSGGEAT
jgi:hypothetical protein